MTSASVPPARPFRIGSRASPLALAQAQMAAQALSAAHGWEEEAWSIVTITTSGDRIQDRPLAEVGGKALWTKELDRALLTGEIDCAVHSMKDVETDRPAAIRIAAMLPRASVEDRLIGAASLADLPVGARIGTSSPRRAAQVRALRPDLAPVLFRGNVATRLARLERGEADATLLASAGLERLGRGDVGVIIPVETMLPAAAQGAVGIEARAGDAATLSLLAAIDDATTHACVLAERALLRALGGNCHSPVAALARMQQDGVLLLAAELLSEDGRESVAGGVRFEAHDAAAPAALAADLLGRASPFVRALFGG
jgi:hydroxymethylbilane synthase